MGEFEMIIITRPDKRKNPFIDFVKEIITSLGGEITSFEDWGKRKLAYPLQGNGHGSYTLINFKAKTKPHEVETVDKLNKLLNEEDLVLKHIIVKKG